MLLSNLGAAHFFSCNHWVACEGRLWQEGWGSALCLSEECTDKG
jgi:hypothetical protein